jgi:broad specificity phosphatase PhoE
MPTPTIYYLRHGETDWNRAGRLQGMMDIPLNALGHEQAVHAGRLLGGLIAANGHDSGALSFVASPLGRARMTMELVRGALNLPPADYGLDKRLREIGYGTWEGHTLAESEALDPELFARRQIDKWTVGAPGGESYADVQERMHEWYNGLRSDSVTVAHGGTARALMVALGFETPESASKLYIEQGVVYVFGKDGLKKYG